MKSYEFFIFLSSNNKKQNVLEKKYIKASNRVNQISLFQKNFKMFLNYELLIIKHF